MDDMKDFQVFINRNNALEYLGNENWDLEDALEKSLLDIGITNGTKRGNQRNTLSTNMTGMRIFVISDPDGCLMKQFCLQKLNILLCTTLIFLPYRICVAFRVLL